MLVSQKPRPPVYIKAPTGATVTHLRFISRLLVSPDLYPGARSRGTYERTMEGLKPFLQGLMPDKRTAALLTGAACGVGAVVVVVQRISSHQKTMDKIQRARNRRTESLDQAEQAVLRYKASVS